MVKVKLQLVDGGEEMKVLSEDESAARNLVRGLGNLVVNIDFKGAVEQCVKRHANSVFQ